MLQCRWDAPPALHSYLSCVDGQACRAGMASPSTLHGERPVRGPRRSGCAVALSRIQSQLSSPTLFHFLWGREAAWSFERSLPSCTTAAAPRGAVVPWQHNRGAAAALLAATATPPGAPLLPCARRPAWLQQQGAGSAGRRPANALSCSKLPEVGSAAWRALGLSGEHAEWVGMSRAACFCLWAAAPPALSGWRRHSSATRWPRLLAPCLPSAPCHAS